MSGVDDCSDGGRLVALWVEDEGHDEAFVVSDRWSTRLTFASVFCFAPGGGRAAGQKAAAEAAVAQEEAGLVHDCSGTGSNQLKRETPYEAVHGPGSVARSRDRARAAWGRIG